MRLTGLDEICRWGLMRICSINVQRTSTGDPLEYFPQGRYVNRVGHKLNPHGDGPFCRFQLPALSASSGVYAIVIGEDVVYIGECQNLSERYGPRGYGVIHPRNCFVGGQSTNCKVNSRVLSAIKDGFTPTLCFVPETEAHRKDVERDLVAKLQPQWNGRA